MRLGTQEDGVNRNWYWLVIPLVILAIAMTACSSNTAPPAPPPPADSPSAPTAAAPAPQAGASPTATLKPTLPAKGALTCPPLAQPASAAQVAARVNGIGIPLDTYNRQAAQATAAWNSSSGMDPKSASAQDALKSLKQQVLDQMINDVVIAVQAEKEGIKVTQDDLDARIAQMIQDAGSVDNLNNYMNKNQLTLADLCNQLRNHLLGEAMLNRVTAALPTNAEQIHVRHILVASAQQAQAVREQLLQGKDFGALAKQYSVDEATKQNGGDLGWLPKGVIDPRFEAIAFQLKVGQISEVVQTESGFHIIKVEEHVNSRPLPPEVIDNKRQQAFLAWLQAVRETMKIEQLVQP
jgi:foldase protein PrsA